MFKRVLKPTYFAPVTVDVPGEAKQTFEAQFRRLGQAELDALMERLKSGEANDDQILRDVLVGWRMKDETGAEVPFDEETLREVLDVFPTRPALVRSFFDTVMGAKAKN